MAQPRFQVFTRRTGAVEWRLIGGNNWELGRSAGTVPDMASALADVGRLQSGLDEVTDEVFPAGPGGGWRWQLVLGDDVLAVSSRSFLRRAACQATLRQFRAVAREAHLPSRLRYFG